MFRTDDKGLAYDDMEVRSSDTDRFFKAKLPFFFTMLQEAAARHSTAMHCGIPELMARENKTWVIVRARMEINTLPDWMESISIETWPEMPYKMFAPRIVKGYDKDRNEVFSTISHWVVIDMNRRRPIKPDEALQYFSIPSDDAHIIDPEIGRFAPPDDFSSLTRLPDFIPVTNYFDTDTNGHINNVSYVNWLCDAFPFSFQDSHRVKVIDCHWAKQTFDGDALTVETYSENKDPLNEDNPSFFTRIVKIDEKGNIVPVFEARTEWIRR